ncbi:MAG: hypothetical protein IJS37_04200 [Bacilli bacterium]|nr:hypothetical protein [Bacilli bacterium]
MKINENIFKTMKQIMYPLSKNTKNTDKQPLLIYENLKAITVNAYKIDLNLTRSILVVPRKEKEALERR